jgi:CheY-like chemotaxis protein
VPLFDEVLELVRGRALIKVEIKNNPRPVGGIERQVVDAVHPLATEHQVRIHAGDALPALYARADPERLRQVLQGLCSAAIKFNRPGGEVTLAFETRDEGRLRIMVSNAGSGIPPGAGPTLAHSRRLVEAMGGALGAESSPGKGTTFWVELPLADSPGVHLGRDESAQPPQPKDRYTVLYIEDNLANLKLVEHVIRQRPRMHLISALQGRRGLELAQDHRPDVILLDLHLPDIQGDEVLRRLRQNPDTRLIPVVVISADAMPAQIKRILDAGARAYLTKPIEIAKLLALVDEILSGGPAGAADAPRVPSTKGAD